MLNLKELREEKGMTRYRLATLTGMQNSTIRSVETEVKNPGFLTVKKMCDALQVDIANVKEK
ncbi:TPA: helix-turn-helix transcriptional regulator [Staphylococcus aureus]|uniref:helix-turn-helix domain-containing protein n=1 Tax=Staphylococcus aureus TaxID=1280 RepID=UPI0013A69678|nr:helix-turn-helix transcriptional regulator [Staphylococcus aureus]NDP74226.1 helix-turn-helix transcriptional regulator [Staphylococcus aureus]NDR07298.1 helix-turn-helix transcriptional regulator [Staphylococcus aureus]HCY6709542.1 helix-turn-helix transcriptional regulator [Staphylococcus aureus]HDD3639921.1 helix-turn-helix transcriptional regulator [Staphylococcus aureus]HDF0195942.1 helix-turn-helix transcriptional regulator [Staphylococcus aureus]